MSMASVVASTGCSISIFFTGYPTSCRILCCLSYHIQRCLVRRTQSSEMPISPHSSRPHSYPSTSCSRSSRLRGRSQPPSALPTPTFPSHSRRRRAFWCLPCHWLSHAIVLAGHCMAFYHSSVWRRSCRPGTQLGTLPFALLVIQPSSMAATPLCKAVLPTSFFLSFSLSL
jgi:hypothetical protein